MSIGLDLFIAVIVFFLGTTLCLVAYYTKKTANTNTNELTENMQLIIQEIERSTEASVAKLEKEKNSIDQKLQELKEMEQHVEEMYVQLMKETHGTHKGVTPNYTDINEKKQKIYQLNQQGLSREQISKRLGIHKGVVETILNFGEYEKKAK